MTHAAQIRKGTVRTIARSFIAIRSKPARSEMGLHGFAVAGRQHDSGAGPAFRGRQHRTDRSTGCVDRQRCGDVSPFTSKLWEMSDMVKVLEDWGNLAMPQ
jgi:hypothetical protein